MIDDTLTERGNRYGKFVEQASAAQAFKNQLRYQLKIRDKHLDPDMMESLEMILHKVARIINGDETYIDNFRDIAGYATLVSNRLIDTDGATDAKTIATRRINGAWEEVVK